MDSKYSDAYLQTMYHKNMEFFLKYNHKLFVALKEDPKQYNLYISSTGINIINLASGALQYPIIDGMSIMLDMHKQLACAPIKNAKWKLNVDLSSLFFNENRLNITGKYANAMLKSAIQDAMSGIDSTDMNILHDRLFFCMLDSFENDRFLPQTAIYGLMGGIFLQILLDEGYRFHSLIIYEENIDFFRISLYFLDYVKLFDSVNDRSCIISIKDINEPITRAFIYNRKITNSLVSLELKHYDSKNASSLRDLISKERGSCARGWGSFEDEKIGMLNALRNLKECRILRKDIKRANAPICVIGNGPSLDLCLDFIKAYQDSMIIFSCGTALGVLRHHGIKPDFQIEIERIDYLSDVLKQAGLDDIALIYAQTTDSKAVDMSAQSYAFMRGGSASAYIDSKICALEFSAPFVGNAGVALALALGSDCILCGIDCGYILGYGKHAKHSFYGNEAAQIPNDCFMVDSNKDLAVYSDDIFYLSARNIEEAIKLYKCNNVINMGYGAKLRGAQSMGEEDFYLRDIDKNLEIEKLKANFISYSARIDSKCMHKFLQEFYTQLRERLYRDDIENLADMFNLVDDISFMLRKYILDVGKRAAIIMIEGSCLHLCVAMLKSYMYSKVRFDIMRGYFLEAIDCFIGDLKKALHA